MREEGRKTIVSSGFEKKSHKYQSKVSCSVYYRNAANVLKEQISETLDGELVHSTHVGQSISHAINAEVGSKVCLAVEKSIKCSEDLSHSWKTIGSNGTKSSVGSHQIFSGKTQVSLSAGALQFHQLHLILSNFLEDRRRMPITCGRNLVMCGPAS